MIEDPDFNLIERYKDGDQEAFNQLIASHQRKLYYFIYRMVSDEEEARDLLQKVLLQCFTHIHRFKFKCKFRTWLYQIAVNMVRNYYRQKGSRRTEELKQGDIVETDTALEMLEEQIKIEQLSEAISQLPEKQHMTLILRINEGNSFSEIASIMNCSVGTAKANFHHAVKKLKQLVKEPDYEV